MINTIIYNSTRWSICDNQKENPYVNQPGPWMGRLFCQSETTLQRRIFWSQLHSNKSIRIGQGVSKILASLTQPIKSNLPARGQDILLLVPSQASNSWRVAKEGSQGSLFSHPVERSWCIPMYFCFRWGLTENDELQHHQCPWRTLNHP